MESLSDHKYVFFAVDASLTGPVIEGTALKVFPRWVIGKVNPNLMEAAAVFSAWNDIPKTLFLERNGWTRYSGISRMPRRGLSRRPIIYWWNQEIAGLRRICNACRRHLTRVCARRKISRESLCELWDALREARRNFRRAIVRSKIKVWAEWINDLDRDP